MNNVENERARAEAAEQVPRALRSARRAQLWAGLNRYLASEAVHAHKVAAEEQEAERAEKEQTGHGRPRRSSTHPEKGGSAGKR